MRAHRAGERGGGSARRALEAASCQPSVPSPGARRGLSRGPRGGALVEAEKQSNHIHTIRIGWLGVPA